MNRKEMMRKYPEGTRLRLISMEGEPQMPEGLRGTVEFVDDLPQIHMRWDNGSLLALNPECDRFEVIRDKIKVVIVPAGEEPRTEYIPNTLSGYQKAVDGYIEMLYPFSDEPDVALVCNEEGKLYKELNRKLAGEDGRVVDIIAGDFFIAMTDEDGFTDLSDEQCEKFMDMFRTVEFYF